MMTFVSRKEALALGLKRYFTGGMCKNGHIAERLTGSRGCVECKKVFRRASAKKAREEGKAWVIDGSRRYQNNNREKCRERNRDWSARNKEMVSARMKKWRKENSRICAFYASLRKARILQATPKWADLDDIRTIYKSCPSGFHVDHIIPLVSEKVCGLHVPDNLRCIPAHENLRKGNSFEFY